MQDIQRQDFDCWGRRRLKSGVEKFPFFGRFENQRKRIGN